MKHRPFFLILAAAIAVPAAAAAAMPQTTPATTAKTASTQARINAYFAAEYLQGQSDSAWAVPTFGGIQAGLMLSGSWATSFNYMLEIRARDGFQPQIEQAWAGWSWSEYVNVKAGVFLVPFGRYNSADRPYQTVLIDAPYGTTDTHPRGWRDIGIVADGNSGFLKYAAFIGNGLAEAESPAGGQQWRDNNKDKGWGGRLDYPISDELDIAASYYQGQQDTAGDRRIRMFGADAGWTTENIQAQAEYTRTDIENPEGFEPGRIEGWYVLLGLTFGSLRPSASYQKSWADDPFHGAGWADPLTAGEGLSWNHSRWTLGLAYTLATNVLLKVEYDWQKEKGTALKDDVLRVQIAAQF